MSELSNKYNIPESTVKQMIKDGWITCSVSKWEEVYKCFKETQALTGKSKDAVAFDVAQKTGASYRNVLYIVERFK